MARKLKGLVVSSTQDKTVVVRVDHQRTHPIYRKSYLESRKYYAHDEKNETHPGDVVEIEETRPISKNKRWKLTAITEKAGEK